LVEKLRISRVPDQDSGKAREDGEATNGGADPKAGETEPSDTTADGTPTSTSPPHTNGDTAKHKGIPDNVKLFEIFYEQVVHIVGMQRLPIQDITSLLVSLVNLALNIYPERLDYVDQVLHYATKE
ncbi:retromer complex subunit Vps35, partial [Teratosphaeriaceae sp. CCFEE 6253]